MFQRNHEKLGSYLTVEDAEAMVLSITNEDLEMDLQERQEQI